PPPVLRRRHLTPSLSPSIMKLTARHAGPATVNLMIDAWNGTAPSRVRREGAVGSAGEVSGLLA
ncbi:hypothetical protein, partial [Micromonospora sp. BL1]|uniref:hypothetical protein n=1 Tax=Micromonospora sp. BL1 TaxID=2478709 RepID=UPI001F458825